MLIKIRKAQSTAEYAILIALVVAAAVGIQNTVRRAIQSRIRDAAMELSGNKEYEPATGLKTTTDQSSTRDKTEYTDAESGAEGVYQKTEDVNKASWSSTESK
jgi:hypothetical protein